MKPRGAKGRIKFITQLISNNFFRGKKIYWGSGIKILTSAYGVSATMLGFLKYISIQLILIEHLLHASHCFMCLGCLPCPQTIYQFIDSWNLSTNHQNLFLIPF